MATAALAVALAGCGGAASERDPGDTLVAGRRGPSPESAALRSGAKLADRFARAPTAYLRSPPPLPGETAAFARALNAAAERVPLARRRLRSRLVGLQLAPLDASTLRASAVIIDRGNPPFSIGFTLRRRGGRWLITTISPPD
jgi:hypothetical protein